MTEGCYKGIYLLTGLMSAIVKCNMNKIRPNALDIAINRTLC